MNSYSRIVQNTVFLYVRMLLVMVVTLYTSRIVLMELGDSNYGIYTLIAGFVTILGFFNAAMVSATQRYLSFDIGKNDVALLQKTFNSTLLLHIMIAILFLVLAQTIGLWYINNKMVYPIDNKESVNILYQFSILSFVVSIIQVPYNAMIIAREKMIIYAYISVLEVILKLLVAYSLAYIFSEAKLAGYSLLLFCTAFLIGLVTYLYCRKNFIECRFSFQNDYKYYKELLAYSVWNIFGNLAFVAKMQGINVVLNLFYGTVINAAYGVSSQVFVAVNMFVSNLQMAMNPQIIKSYSQQNLEQSQRIILQGSKFSFLLVLLIATPILMNTEYILELWLSEPPKYSIIFVQFTLINILIDSLSGTLMTGIQATGRIKNYQIIVGTMVFLNLPLSYILLKVGFEPYIVYLVSILIGVLSLQLRLIFLNIVMKFNIRIFYKSVMLRAIVLSIIIFFCLYLKEKYFTIPLNIHIFVIETIVSLGIVGLLILMIGLSSSDKKMLKNFVLKKIN